MTFDIIWDTAGLDAMQDREKNKWKDEGLEPKTSSPVELTCLLNCFGYTASPNILFRSLSFFAYLGPQEFSWRHGLTFLCFFLVSMAMGGGPMRMQGWESVC